MCLPNPYEFMKRISKYPLKFKLVELFETIFSIFKRYSYDLHGTLLSFLRPVFLRPLLLLASRGRSCPLMKHLPCLPLIKSHAALSGCLPSRLDFSSSGTEHVTEKKGICKCVHQVRQGNGDWWRELIAFVMSGFAAHTDRRAHTNSDTGRRTSSPKQFNDIISNIITSIWTCPTKCFASFRSGFAK